MPEFDDFLTMIRAERELIVPFIGAGLTIAAGAPPAWRLARQLVVRGGLARVPDPGDLVV
jgi:hypothetical protein